MKDLEEKHNHLLKSIKTSILIKKQVETLQILFLVSKINNVLDKVLYSPQILANNQIKLNKRIILKFKNYVIIFKRIKHNLKLNID